VQLVDLFQRDRLGEEVIGPVAAEQEADRTQIAGLILLRGDRADLGDQQVTDDLGLFDLAGQLALCLGGLGDRGLGLHELAVRRLEHVAEDGVAIVVALVFFGLLARRLVVVVRRGAHGRGGHAEQGHCDQRCQGKAQPPAGSYGHARSFRITADRVS
jgi:hypothetical protein